MKTKELRLIANTIRGLSIDAIQKANSGHPGLPMGMADVASVLFSEYLRFNPKDPNWLNRDRFILSGGHGSMLLYSLLHLFGYDLTLEDIKQFRQWGSKTPGHPEYRHTAGVETTTGPLGQGFSNAAGLAIGSSHLAALVSSKKHKINLIDNYTYVFVGDGDMEEGISHEVASLAGHLGLDKLVVFYDFNSITIDGAISLSSSDDVKKRFEAYNWDVIVIDGHKYKDIRKGIEFAQKKKSKPTLIITETTIGFGSPNKAGTSNIHGSPLGEEEILLTKKNLGLSLEKFHIEDEVYSLTKQVVKRNRKNYKMWYKSYDEIVEADGKKIKLLNRIVNKDFDNEIFEMDNFNFPEKIATRAASLTVLNSIFNKIPSIIGGSADLTPSNKTKTKDVEVYSENNRKGKYIHYGIREHGMAGIMNGIALFSGLIPYSGTFMVFSDYFRPSLRMAAIMKLQSIFVLSHDSIGLGEDGPTHQPIEQLASLRLIPNTVNFRPMDASETAIGWKVALKRRTGPTNLFLSRQSLPVYLRRRGAFANANKAENGGYVLTQDKDFQVILIGSGSEVEIAINAKKLLNEKGIKVRVVSMPSQELFNEQSKVYKNSVLYPKCKLRLAIEAGHPDTWYKYVGEQGRVLGIDHFGASAPFPVLYKEYGLTAENIVKNVLEMIKK